MLSQRHEVIEIADDEAKLEKVMNPGVSSSKFPFLHSILQRKYENKIRQDIPKLPEPISIHLSPLKKEQQAQQISNLVRVETNLIPNLVKQVKEEKISSNAEFTPPDQSKEVVEDKMDIQEAVEIDKKQFRQQEDIAEEQQNCHEKEQSIEQKSIIQRSKGQPQPEILTVEVCLDPIRLPADPPSPCFSQDEEPINQPSNLQNATLIVVQDYNTIVPIQTFEANKSYSYGQVISADQLRQNKMDLIQKYLSMQKSQGNNSSPESQVQQLAAQPYNSPNLQIQAQSIADKTQLLLVNQERVNDQNHPLQQSKDVEVLAQVPAQMIEEVQLIQNLQSHQGSVVVQNEIIANNIVFDNSQEPNKQKNSEQIIDLVEIVQQNVIIPSIESANHIITPQQQAIKVDVPIEQLDYIKKKIVELLPDLEQSISSLSAEELLQIYNKVKDQLSHSLQSENPQFQAHQPQEAILTHNQVPSENQHHQNSIIGKVHQPVENIAQLHPFYTLRELDEQSLRNEMIKNFPEAKQSILGMNESQLRDLLNEALAQIQKQANKGENSAAKSSNNNHSLSNNTSVMRTNDHLPSTLEMRAYLVEIAPKLQRQIEEISQNFIEQLYKQAKDRGTSKLVKGAIQVEHSIILKMCLQKMPNLSSEIEKLSKQQLTKIYDSLKAKLNTLPKTPSKPNPQISKPVDNKANPQTPKQTPIQKSPKQPEPSLKRNYETMLSTDPKVSNSDGKKKKTEYRAKLLRKFPGLKENIMKLDDNELEKIFKESIDPHNTKKTQKPDDPKPIIVLSDKKFVPEPAISQKQQTLSNCEQPASMAQNCLNKYQPKVVQLQSQGGRKKSRTVVLIHTEDIDQDQLDKRQKSRRIGDFSDKKWNCECLNNVTVSDLVRKLTELIDKKAE